jgi:hypothetical protein
MNKNQIRLELSDATLAPAACSATLPDWHRVSIRYDGAEIMGVTVTCKRPDNHEQMTALIRELLDCMNAPTVLDPEVLGDKSPNVRVSDGANSQKI